VAVRSQPVKKKKKKKKNPLETYFLDHKGREIHKWMHYFDVYHRHFEKYRGKPVTVVEFGVHYGGSLQMWRDYFGARARIFGVDILPTCKQWEEPGVKIFIGDQSDRDFLRRIAKKIGPIDVLIEDGGHHPAQQIATFEVMYPAVKPDGVFLIEDLHTSYWKRYSGGLRKPGTFMEYAKGLADQLNAYHGREPGFEPDDFTRTTKSIHFYDSIVVFEKGDSSDRPVHKRIGVASWDPADQLVLHRPLFARVERKARGAARRGRRIARRLIRGSGPSPQAVMTPTSKASSMERHR
jgi:23S rRNA U2552 (ribose-2'-O)-methylase RlmE/FtsJ